MTAARETSRAILVTLIVCLAFGAMTVAGLALSREDPTHWAVPN